MKLIELNIVEFGGLTNKHYSLSDGLNIFYGDNETGKSTIWLFVKFMLYGVPKKGTAEREKYLNRSTHVARGSMIVEYRGEQFRIERSFSENSRGKVNTYRVSDGAEFFSGEEPGEAMLSVPRDIFENSSSIGQSQCTGLVGSKSVASIRNLLSSADESIDIGAIEKKLNSIRVKYRHIKGNGGMLYEMSEQINQLEGRLKRATDSRLRISELEEKLQKNTALTEENDKDLSLMQTLLGRLQKKEILRRFDSLEENKKQLSSLYDEKNRLFEKELKTEVMPTDAHIARLSMLCRECELADAQILKTDQKLSSLEERSKYDAQMVNVGKEITESGGLVALKSALQKTKSLFTVGMIGIAVGAVATAALVALGLALSSTLLPYSAIGAIALAAGIFGVAVSSAKKKKITEKYAKGATGDTVGYASKCIEAYNQKLTNDEDIARAEAEKKGILEQKERLAAELVGALRLTGVLGEYDLSYAYAEIERLGRFLEESKRLKLLIERASALVQNEEKILSVYNEKEIRASMTDELPDISVSEAENKLAFYKSKADVLRQSDSSLRTELINLKAVNEDPAAISDTLSELKQKQRSAEEYYDALVLAIDGIGEASKAMQGNITPIIAKNAGKLIDHICDGEYDGVNMGSAMNLSLVDKDGLTTSLEMMSGGTKDMAYFALRLSLIMQIFEDELPPLMMDETLCQLDDGRMKKVLGILDKLCTDGWQCLLFSCHLREAAAVTDMGIDAKLFKMES